MPRYVALFRGINVGKAKRIAMADLRALLEKLGFTEVQTLLNSGNAVFTAAAEAPVQLATRLRAAVARKLGVDALVIIKSAKDVDGIIAGNALGKLATDHSRLLVVMANDAKALGALKSAQTTAHQPEWGAERVHVGKHAAYVWCANGILESKALGAVLTTLKMSGTTRNWATLLRIHALLATDGKKA
jgi:uncharacterized protein (DUF1697 family)